jgi:hypothetical protein
VKYTNFYFYLGLRLTLLFFFKCEQRFMLDCDDCHRWFHGECVGVDPSIVPPLWYCDQCLLRRQLQQHKQNIAEHEESITKNASKKQSASTSSFLLSPIRRKRKVCRLYSYTRFSLRLFCYAL